MAGDMRKLKYLWTQISFYLTNSFKKYSDGRMQLRRKLQVTKLTHRNVFYKFIYKRFMNILLDNNHTSNKNSKN